MSQQPPPPPPPPPRSNSSASPRSANSFASPKRIKGNNTTSTKKPVQVSLLVKFLYLCVLVTVWGVYHRVSYHHDVMFEQLLLEERSSIEPNLKSKQEQQPAKEAQKEEAAEPQQQQQQQLKTQRGRNRLSFAADRKRLFSHDNNANNNNFKMAFDSSTSSMSLIAGGSVQSEPGVVTGGGRIQSAALRRRNHPVSNSNIPINPQKFQSTLQRQQQVIQQQKGLHFGAAAENPLANHQPHEDKDPLPPPDYNHFDLGTEIDPNHHAIIIPYRDRSFHLQEFVKSMHPYLQHHFPNHTFSLWVIEQANDQLFNRGWLTNVGIQEILNQQQRHDQKLPNCVILHDVDLLPNTTSTHVPYTSCAFPIHLSRQMENFKWGIPYPRYCGGITALSLQHWIEINGMSNDYVGWGGEDDDLYHRLRMNSLLLHPNKKEYPVPLRPPNGTGIFRAINQSSEHHVQQKNHNNSDSIFALLDIMWRNSPRWQNDGLNDLYYTVLNSQTMNYTARTSNKTTTAKSTAAAKRGEGGFDLIHHVEVIPKRTILKQQQSTTTTESSSTAEGGGAGSAATTAAATTSSGHLPILELLDIPYSGGQFITRIAARSNIVWGACHYGNYTEYECHKISSSTSSDSTATATTSSSYVGDWKYDGTVNWRSYHQSRTPWYLRLPEWKNNPIQGTDRFVIVRNPYHRAIEFYRTWYDRWNGTTGINGTSAATLYREHHLPEDKTKSAEYYEKRENAESLNSFLQQYLDQRYSSWSPLDYMRGVDDLLPQIDSTGLRKKKYASQYKWIHHVLKYESLKQDFQNLILEKYPHYEISETEFTNLAEELGKHGRGEAGRKTLRVNDLAPETIDLINGVYRNDFILFKYERREGTGNKTTAELKEMKHPRKKNHKNAYGEPQVLEYIQIPFTGVEAEITRAGARHGFVWGACHYDEFKEYECPQGKSGDHRDNVGYALSTDQAQEPWLSPMLYYHRNPYEKSKTFAVVRNPYSRAIAFYRHMYDRQHHAGGQQRDDDRQYITVREDRETMNRWLQEYFVKHHHAHRPDGLHLSPMYKYTSKLHYLPKVETLHSSMTKMLSRIRTKPVPEGLQEELLSIELKNHTQEHEGKWLDIKDLSDLTVAMINDIYRIDFFKYYPSMRIATNTTSLTAYWKKILPLPPQPKPKKTKAPGTTNAPKPKVVIGSAEDTTATTTEQALNPLLGQQSTAKHVAGATVTRNTEAPDPSSSTSSSIGSPNINALRLAKRYENAKRGRTTPLKEAAAQI